ncbi:hypothetical protein VTI74DRAFT_649 [Chaetomium olivicolor]
MTLLQRRDLKLYSDDCGQRPKKFWDEWEKLNEKLNEDEEHYFDNYPWDRSTVARLMLAKFYKAGVIDPAPLEAHRPVVPGYAIANTEPHRHQLDLFTKCTKCPKSARYCPPETSTARTCRFSSSQRKGSPRPNRRRASPCCACGPRHILDPLMIAPERRHFLSVFDPVGRVWEWKFFPKDIPLSESSGHNAITTRLRYLRELMTGVQDTCKPQGRCELVERVVQRGILVLVMGKNERVLLWWTTMVTFGLQTKLWLREADLRKSFVNEDLAFLERWIKLGCIRGGLRVTSGGGRTLILRQ